VKEKVTYGNTDGEVSYLREPGTGMNYTKSEK
jgi:hypothetical protein